MIALAGSAAHVFVDDLRSPALEAHDEHHLARVLRLRDGERVSASDGRGSWAWCHWSSGALVPDSDVVSETQRRPTGVAVSLIKGDRLDWVVQKATEIGVDRIVPMAAELSVVRWAPDKALAQQQRLARIAREAAMQSRRVWLPVVESLADAASVFASPGVVCADMHGARSLADIADPADGVPLMVAVGPEGGWGERERATMPVAVRLGDTVLRTETAAVVASVMLTLRGRR